MRSLRNFAVFGCLLCVPAVFGQTAVSQPQDWRFAHPGATLVGSFRVKAMLDSSLVNTLIAQATAKDPSTGAIVGMMRPMLGGIEEIRFSVRDMGKGKNPDVVALVMGTLDENAARAMSQGKTAVRRIDANTLLVGEGPSLDEAAARMRKPATGLQARALDRGKALANYDLWIAGSLPEMPMTVPVLSSMRSIAFGLSAQSDLRMELAIETASPKMAEDLVSEARKSQAKQPGVGAALQSEADGSTARFRFVMEGDQVVQAVQQAIENSGKGQSPFSTLLGQPGFRSSTPQTPVVAEPPAPPKPPRDTVVIYGLEGGPREIKTDKP